VLSQESFASTRIMQMRNKLTFTSQQSRVYDYSASVPKAADWLCDRCLLANLRKKARSTNAGEHTSRMQRVVPHAAPLGTRKAHDL
jgi:hypothetical protein